TGAVEDFETLALGTPPKGWTVAQTIGEKDLKGTLAKWEVQEAKDAPSGKRVLRLVESKNRGEVFNLCLRDAPPPADLLLEVKLHAESGSEDRGGGLVWRAQDERNYYLARWNPLEHNLRVYKVENARRVQLQNATVDADANAWHTLRVTMKGRVIE